MLEVPLPDVERAVLTVLRAGLGSAVTVDLENPRGPLTGDFVRARRVGGTSRSRVVDVPTLDVLVWSTDRGRRMRLAQDARGLLYAAAGTVVDGVAVGQCRDLLGPRRMPDPATFLDEVVMFTVTIAMQTIPE